MRMSGGQPTPIYFDIYSDHSKFKRKEPPIKGWAFDGLVGELLWLARNTFPTISTATAILARHVKDPQDNHYYLADKVLKYLAYNLEKGLRYKRGGEGLASYADSDFASDPKDRKSQTGNIIFLAGGPIIWDSKKQSRVAQSTAEAELYALNRITNTIQWLRSIHVELQIPFPQPLTVREDNQPCMHIAKNGIGASKSTKHMDISVHFVTQCIEEGVINLEYIRTTDNPADVFTKLIKTPLLFEQLSSQIMTSVSRPDA